MGTEPAVAGLDQLTPAGSPSSGLGGFDFPILGWGVRHQRVHQPPGIRGDCLDRLFEYRLVGPRRTVGPRNLANILQGCGLDLVIGGRGIEVVKGSDAATHTFEATERRSPLFDIGNDFRPVRASQDQHMLVSARVYGFHHLIYVQGQVDVGTVPYPYRHSGLLLDGFGDLVSA